MTQISFFGQKINFSFNEYNKKTKKKKQIKMDLTEAHQHEIMRQMDSTDMGTFFDFEDDKKIVSGFFSFVEE